MPNRIMAWHIHKTTALALLFFSVSLGYHSEWAWSIPRWLSFRGFYSHGLLLVAFVGYLLWRDRHRLLAEPRPANAIILLLTVGSAFFWWIAWAAELIVLQLFAAFFVTLTAACYLLGRRSVIFFGLPFAILILALPVWGPIQPGLQAIATFMVSRLVGLAGIPILVDGNFIETSKGIFEVAGGCSGLGFLLTTLTLASFTALVYKPTRGQLALIFAVAFGGGLAVNWLRITLIVLIGNHYGLDHPIVEDHVSFGWAIYIVVLAATVPLFNRLLRSTATKPLEAAKEGLNAQTRATSISLARLVMVLSVVNIFPLIVLLMESLERHRLAPVYDMSQNIEASDITSNELAQWFPTIPGADWSSQGTINAEDTPVYFYQASFFSQDRNGEMISIRNDFTGPRWYPPRRGTVVVRETDRLSVNETFGSKFAGDRILIWYWYQVGEAFVQSSFDVKRQQLVNRLLGRSDGSVFVIATFCGRHSTFEIDRDCSAARLKLVELVNQLTVGNEKVNS